ncbi:MAG: YceI family protein [Opitutaceae bacterium]|nr:YceI family protein [Cytophagales bacterium]
MRKTYFASGIIVSALILSSFLPKNKEELKSNPAELQKADTYAVDINKSKIYWTGKGVGKQHTGFVTIQSGTVLIDTKTVTGGFMYINMKSITNTDIKDAGFNKNLVDHLKSPDFFFAAKFPTSTFKIIKAERLDVPEGQPNYKVLGELTIKGIKKPIEFLSTIKYIKKSIVITGDAEFDRTIYDVKYNSGNFFQDLGDKLIEDKVQLKLDIHAEIK